MKAKHLWRIGAVIVLSFLVLLLADTRAHAKHDTPLSTPEIDAGMVVSGVTLLIASTMVLVDRFRRR